MVRRRHAAPRQLSLRRVVEWIGFVVDARQPRHRGGARRRRERRPRSWPARSCSRVTTARQRSPSSHVRPARRAVRGVGERHPQSARGIDRARDREQRQHAQRREVRSRRRRRHAVALRRARREARKPLRCSATARPCRSTARRGWPASTCGRASAASRCISTRSTFPHGARARSWRARSSQACR